MGGWGAALGGAISGIGQHAHEQNLLQLQQNAAQKDALMKFYEGIMNNPNLEHMAPEAAQAFLHISTTPLDNKWQSSVAKFSKQYDPQVMNDTALTRHANQHPGVQAAQQLQMPPGLTPTKVSGVPGEQAGAADGAAHQFAMQQQTPQQPQPGSPQQQQPIQLSPTPGQQQEPQAQQPQQGQAQQATGMLAATTGAMNGNLPNPSPVPQISPSPMQASAAAGQQPQQQQPAYNLTPPTMPDAMQHPHFGMFPDERAQVNAYNIGMKEYQERLAALHGKEDEMHFQRAQRQQMLQSPEIQNVLKGLPPLAQAAYVAQILTGQAAPNMGAMASPHILAAHVSGAKALAQNPSATDMFDNPLDPHGDYTSRSVMGQVELIPNNIQRKIQLVSNPADGGKTSLLASINPYDHEDVDYIKDLSKVNPAMLEQIRTTNGVKFVNINGQVVAEPVTATTGAQRVAPGMTPPPAATGGITPPPPTKPAARPQTPKGASVGTGRVLGDTQGTFNLQQPTATTRTMAQAAPAVLQLADDLKRRVTAQKQMLGPAAGRWNEFYAGKIGAPNPEFSKIRTDATLLQTRLMKMHTGSNGAVAIMQHFKDILDTGKQSPENLIAALETIEDYAKGVAQEGNVKRDTSISAAPGEVTELERGPDGKLKIKGR